MKKIVFFCFLVGVFLLTTVSAFSIYFESEYYPDVSTDNTYYWNSIDFLTDKGIVDGYPDGTYKPENLLNRAEFLKLVIEAEYDDADYTAFSSRKCFNDVPESEWYTQYVCFAKEKGFIVGYDGNLFKPENEITLMEAIKIVMKVFEYDCPESCPWYMGCIDNASRNNFIPYTFRDLYEKVDRGQMADMVTRVLKYESGNLHDYLCYYTMSPDYGSLNNDIDEGARDYINATVEYRCGCATGEYLNDYDYESEYQTYVYGKYGIEAFWGHIYPKIYSTEEILILIEQWTSECLDKGYFVKKNEDEFPKSSIYATYDCTNHPGYTESTWEIILDDEMQVVLDNFVNYQAESNCYLSQFEDSNDPSVLENLDVIAEKYGTENTDFYDLLSIIYLEYSVYEWYWEDVENIMGDCSQYVEEWESMFDDTAEKENWIKASAEAFCYIVNAEDPLDPSIEEMAMEIYESYGFDADDIDAMMALNEKYKDDEELQQALIELIEECSNF